MPLRRHDIADCTRRPAVRQGTGRVESIRQIPRAAAGSGDGGIDCVAYDPHPITGGKFIVQAKLYTRTVQPTHVRDLWGTVQHEGATKGIMITTSGYGPDSYKFAGGKPLNLIDGSGLLSLCQQNAIPARILNRGKSTRDP